jgi:prepilin-type N-terminal cleavage/methylation domain-containing protein
MAGNSRAAFTLIELLVVIGILSLLVVTFIPDIIGVRRSANEVADSKQLQDQFAWMEQYRQRYQSWPEGGGYDFILDTWVKGVVPRSPANLDRFFTPGVREKDEHWRELKRMPIDQVWKDHASLSSKDTTYAGRSSKWKSTIDAKPTEPLAADDNEDGWNLLDGRINVLCADGNVYTFDVNTDLKQYGATLAKPFEVGPDSPHPDLQKLAK